MNCQTNPLKSRVWDDDTSTARANLPDVMLQVRLGTSQDLTFTSIERFPDTEARAFVFERNMDFKIENVFPELRLTVADLDIPNQLRYTPLSFQVLQSSKWFS